MRKFSETVYFPNCLNNIIASYARDEDVQHAKRLLDKCMKITNVAFHNEKYQAILKFAAKEYMVCNEHNYSKNL